jgi:hypothetical protein
MIWHVAEAAACYFKRSTDLKNVQIAHLQLPAADPG